jgi:ribosome-binding factor A
MQMQCWKKNKHALGKLNKILKKKRNMRQIPILHIRFEDVENGKDHVEEGLQ